VHTPTFNVDESAIEIGMGMMASFGAELQFKNGSGLHNLK